MNRWTVSPIYKAANSKPVFEVMFLDVRAGWEQYVLLTGDRHHDNKYSLNSLEKKHLDLAAERNAPIIDIGDLFCAMQGRNDRRQSRDELRAELAEADNYFDLLLDSAESFYTPYAHLFAVMGTGNHETAVRRNVGLDLTYNIAKRLRRSSGNLWPLHGGYGGYTVFKFDTGKMFRKRLRYFHGAGGSAPVTKGVIHTNRRAVMWPDADIIAAGHTHEAFVLPITQERISERGVIRQMIQWHIQVPSYKDEYGNSSEWATERGSGPKPLGCAWLHFSYNSSNDNRGIDVRAELDII